MTEPIRMRVDLEIPAAYVKYSKTTSVETRSVIDGGAVAYDLDDAGAVVGLEVLWIDDPAHVEAARTFAAQHDLAFPRDLLGNLGAAYLRYERPRLFLNAPGCKSPERASALARNPNFRFVLAIECVARNRRLITDEKVDAASLEQSIGEDDEIRSRIGAGRRYK